MRFSRSALVCRGLAAAAAPALSIAPARAADFEFKLAHSLPVEHPVGVGAAEFAGNVRRETNGRVNITVFANSVLGGDVAQIQQVQVGATQIAIVPNDVLGTVVPISGIERVGFAFPDERRAMAAMNGELGAYVRNDIAAKGFVPFEQVWSTGFREITTSTHPIRNVNDLSGLRIRVPPAPIGTDLFKSLGASPAPLSITELYAALQNHLLEGMDGGYAIFMTFKVYDVQKFLSTTNHQWGGERMVMNPGAWKSLPSDLQDVVRRNGNLAGARASRSGALANDSVRDKLVRLGLKPNVADTSTFRPLLGDYYARWKREFGATAWSLLEKYAGKLA